jgi:hypothetical protein
MAPPPAGESPAAAAPPPAQCWENHNKADCTSNTDCKWKKDNWGEWCQEKPRCQADRCWDCMDSASCGGVPAAGAGPPCKWMVESAAGVNHEYCRETPACSKDKCWDCMDSASCGGLSECHWKTYTHEGAAGAATTATTAETDGAAATAANTAPPAVLAAADATWSHSWCEDKPRCEAGRCWDCQSKATCGGVTGMHGDSCHWHDDGTATGYCSDWA